MKAFSCPNCGGRLEAAGPEAWICPNDQGVYRRVDGIWRFLTPENEKILARFIREYETIREAEGRGSEEPEYYRRLPFEDLSGKLPEMWRMRAATYRTFERRVLRSLPAASRILDLGAGNGWLSNQLAGMGHTVDAVDLLVNDRDGLGTWKHYENVYRPIQAAFDALPLRGLHYDLVVFNAAFHYAADYDRVLRHVLPRLAEDGKLVILDTPFYHRVESGIRMVHERETDFKKRYGFPSNAIRMENFLTDSRLATLAAASGLAIIRYRTWFGWKRAGMAVMHRLRGRRELARFPVIVLERKAAR